MTDKFSIAKQLRRGNRIGVIDAKGSFYNPQDVESGYHYTNADSIGLYNLAKGFRATISNTNWLGSDLEIADGQTFVPLDPEKFYEVTVDEDRVILVESEVYDPFKEEETIATDTLSLIDQGRLVSYTRNFADTRQVNSTIIQPTVGVASLKTDTRAMIMTVKVFETNDGSSNEYSLELTTYPNKREIQIRCLEGQPLWSEVAGMLASSNLLELDPNFPFPDFNELTDQYNFSAIAFRLVEKTRIRVETFENQHNPISVFPLDEAAAYIDDERYDLGRLIRSTGRSRSFLDQSFTNPSGTSNERILKLVVPQKAVLSMDMCLISSTGFKTSEYHLIKHQYFLELRDRRTGKLVDDIRILLEKTSEDISSGTDSGTLYHLNLVKTITRDTLTVKTRLDTSNAGMMTKSVVDTHPDTQFIGMDADLITYSDLIERTGVVGSTITTVEQDLWLKFRHKGKTLFLSYRPVTTGVSYNELYSKGLVYGTDSDKGRKPTSAYTGPEVKTYQVINIKGDLYIVRLLKTFNDVTGLTALESAIGRDTPEMQGSEFDQLIYPLLSDLPASISYNGTSKGLFTEESLYFSSGIAGGTGTMAWCQEAIESSDDPATYLMRPVRGLDVTYGTGSYLSSYANVAVGWRPVLEYIEPESIRHTGTIAPSETLIIPFSDAMTRVVSCIVRLSGSTNDWVSSEDVLTIKHSDHSLTLTNESTSSYEYKVIS